MKSDIAKQRTSKKRVSVTIGRRGFAQISAVEGIRLSDEMWADFKEFDHRGLSSTERRKAIVRKYTATR